MIRIERDHLTDVAIFDLDGTITDSRQRDYLNPRLTEGYDGNGDKWIPFSMAAGDDLPNLPVLDMMDGVMARRDTAIFIITGRTIYAHEVTVEWLKYYGVPFDLLWMRGKTDYRPNVDLKLGRLSKIRKSGFNPVLWVDDYSAVTDAMEKEGIPTMLVNFELRP